MKAPGAQVMGAEQGSARATPRILAPAPYTPAATPSPVSHCIPPTTTATAPEHQHYSVAARALHRAKPPAKGVGAAALPLNLHLLSNCQSRRGRGPAKRGSSSAVRAIGQQVHRGSSSE